MPSFKKAAGTLVATAMFAGLTTVATATTASASDWCNGSWYGNPALTYTYWVPDHNLSYAPSNYDSCVSDLQQMLNEQYSGANLATDGYFGPNTLAWVRKFQGDLSWCTGGADGIVGRNTYSCLDWATGNHLGSPK